VETDSGSPEVAVKPANGEQLPSRNRIMVVDDESDITSAMKIGLEDNGFDVKVFNDPLSALASYKPGAYDLLILDVKMPKMNGFELYREIRKIDEKARVCFLTAFEMYMEEFRRVFPSMDVKHFIQKPITMNDLVAQIRKITGQ
jgi:DNA-binding response OmpR family regulator